MDMMTLAMAKAYTDSKVGNGSSSGGGIPVIKISQVVSYSEERCLLNTEEAAVAEAAAQTGLPVIVEFTTDEETKMCEILQRVEYLDGSGDLMFHSEFTYLNRTDGVWSINVRA